MRFQDQVVIITGAGSGIGQATAQLFAAEGATVAVADIAPRLAAETVGLIESAGGRAKAYTVDVTKKQQVDELVAAVADTFSHIDVLVNNAANSSGNDILTIDEETWDFNLNLVLKSVFLCSKAVLPIMIEQKKGAIVNISSINGLNAHGMEPYSAGKAGVINLTKNMAAKYSHMNIRTNAISPGTVETPHWAPMLKENPGILDEIGEEWIPIGRVGQPEDVAKAALFLASDDAAWITGTNLVVDGGMSAVG